MPQFYNIKVGFKGVFNTQICYPDVFVTKLDVALFLLLFFTKYLDIFHKLC